MTDQEWRTLPEFPTYEITSDGDVRNRDTGHDLKESLNKTTGAYSYSLWKDGKNYSRHFWGLVHSAWPELKPEPEWRTHPDYPAYEVSRGGLARVKRTRHGLIPKVFKGDTEAKVRFRVDGQRIDVPVTELAPRTYSEDEELV